MENKLSTLTASEWIIVLGIVNKYKYTILKLMKDDGGELERLRKEADGPTLDGETPPGILLIHSFHNIWYYFERIVFDAIDKSIKDIDDNMKNIVFKSIPNDSICREMDTYCKELHFELFGEHTLDATPWYAMYHLKRKIWDSLGIKYPYLD